MRKATFLAFAVGAAIGSAATWYYAKTKYEQIAQEEIDSVKEKFSYEKDATAPDEPKNGPKKPSVNDTEKPSVAEYAKRLAQEGYTDYSTSSEIDPDEDEEEPVLEPVPDVNDNPQEAPYVISPDQFGEFADYDTISFLYYADDILADDNDEILEDVEGVVGFDSLNHFGEYEDDAVHVRNDRLKCDYEILRSLKTYKELLQQKPYLRGEV